MTRKKDTNAIPFPANTGWVTAQMHAFMPRELNETLQNQLGEMMIRNDDQVRQVLRSCKDKWIFAVTLGQTTIHLKIYEPNEVNDPHYKPMSSAVNRARTTFFEIDRFMHIRQLTVEETNRVMRTAPIAYSDRCLKQQEIKLLNQMQETMQAPTETVKVEDDGYSIDHLRPDFALEPA